MIVTKVEAREDLLFGIVVVSVLLLEVLVDCGHKRQPLCALSTIFLQFLLPVSN